MKFTFQHLSGSKAGQSEIFEGRVVSIGRDPASNLAFDPYQDDKVSGNHAQILVTDTGEVLLSDLGSSNGTFLGEQQVQRPTPLHNGAMVTFGKDGPQVRINFELASDAPPPPAAAAPPPPPAQEKKSKTGCILVLIILLFGGCVAGGVSYWLLVVQAEGEGAGEVVEVPDGETPDGETPIAEVPDATPEPTPEPEPEPAAKKNPWGDCGVGTTFEMKSLTDMEVAGNKMQTESTLKYELVELTDEVAKVKMTTVTMVGENAMENSTDMEVQLYPEVVEGEEPEYVEEKETEVTVPAGTFSCTYRKMETETNGQKTTTEMWMDDDMPVPYKTVTTNPTMVSTTELAAQDKK